jgi:hypothetical protein
MKRLRSRSLQKRNKPRSLSGWTKYCKAVAHLSGNSELTAVRSNLNRFNAKFRLAANIQPFKVAGIGEETTSGYNAALKLFLAYTAAELLGECIGQKIEKWPLHDQQLADTLRKALANVEIRKDEIFQPKTSQRMANFISSNSDHIFGAAFCIRVMVAHGTFTVNGVMAYQSKVRTALLRMADLILDEAERQFQAWLEVQLAKQLE